MARARLSYVGITLGAMTYFFSGGLFAHGALDLLVDRQTVRLFDRFVRKSGFGRCSSCSCPGSQGLFCCRRSDAHAYCDLLDHFFYWISWGCSPASSATAWLSATGLLVISGIGLGLIGIVYVTRTDDDFEEISSNQR